MFFDDPTEIESLAKRTGFSIFVLSSKPNFTIKNSLEIFPDEKTHKITIDKVREIFDFCTTKQESAFFIIIQSAETMNEAAENALLKLLEEPSKNYHFVLITSDLTALLPTVLSRASIFTERVKNPLDLPLNCSESAKIYAKKLITASRQTLLPTINEITSDKKFKQKEDSRSFVLEIVAAAIEISYKSYFQTKNTNFLKKLPKYLKLYDNLKQNGHIKLHLIADLC